MVKLSHTDAPALRKQPGARPNTMEVSDAMIVPTPESDRARFWAKVDKNGPTPPHCPDLGPCWLWTASPASKRYGKFTVNRRTISAHRFAWLLTVGEIDSGLECCHHCDNMRCVRPAHLFLGTTKDNAQDKVRKGRLRLIYGEQHRNTKLTDEQVREIYRRVWDGEMQRDLAAEFGICRSKVSAIKARKTRVAALALLDDMTRRLVAAGIPHEVIGPAPQPAAHAAAGEGE